MSRFTAEGTFPVEIVEAIIAEPKFSKSEGAFDIAIKVRDAEGHEDWWRGEISGEYGKGNNADKTQAQLTLRTLKNIGWEHGFQFDALHSLIGTQTVVTIAQKDGYYNIKYLGSNNSTPVALSPEAVAARLANVAMFFPVEDVQEEVAAPAPAPAPAKPTAAAKPAAPAPAMPKPKAPVAPAAAAPVKKNPFLAS